MNSPEAERLIGEFVRTSRIDLDSPMNDPVNRPSHYTSHPSGVECIQVVEHMTFNLGNAIKYIWRHGLKPNPDSLEDLRKARWYIDREIQRLQVGDHK
jgi:hypothetical protein